MDTNRLATIITPVLERFDLELEALDIVGDGGRTVLRVVVDGDGTDGTGPLLDDIAEATREVSRALDESKADGAKAYTLEVSSRGTSRPLTKPAHWRRNAGRLVKISNPGQPKFVGRITASDDDGVDLDVDGGSRRLAYDEIGSALIQVELKKDTEGSK